MNAISSPPSIFERPPEGTAPSLVRGQLERTVSSRRNVLRVFGVMLVAMAAASVDMLPRIGARASAAPPTRVDCDYPDSWKICNPDAASVSTTYCNGAGYHRIDSTSTACESRDYVRDWRCGSIPGGGDYNAWVWRKAWGPNTGPPDVRCSDGYVHCVDKSPCRESRRYSIKSTCKELL